MIMDQSQLTSQNQPEFLTRSPQMNAVIREAQSILDGGGDPEALGRKIQELDMFLVQFTHVFNQESRFEEETEEFLTEADIIEESLEKIREHVREIKKFFEAQDEVHLETGIEGCIEIFEKLFGSIDRLKARERKRHIYCRSPYVNEVMRVADCVMRGTLPPDALDERITLLIGVQERLYKNFEFIEPAEEERLVFEDNRDAILDNLEELLDGLYEATNYFQDSNVAHLEDGLDRACKAGDFLMEIEDKMRAAREAPQVKLCFKCGADNPKDVKFCIKCNYRFPVIAGQEESTLDLRAEESGVKQTGHIMTENTLRLSRAVEDVQAKRIQMDEFLDTLAWFNEILENTKIEAGKIKEPDSWGTQEAKEFFENFKTTFKAGIQEIETGLGELRTYTETSYAGILDTGLERILSGTDKLCQVQAIADQIAAMADQPPPQE